MTKYVPIQMHCNAFTYRIRLHSIYRWCMIYGLLSVLPNENKTTHTFFSLLKNHLKLINQCSGLWTEIGNIGVSSALTDLCVYKETDNLGVVNVGCIFYKFFAKSFDIQSLTSLNTLRPSRWWQYQSILTYMALFVNRNNWSWIWWYFYGYDDFVRSICTVLKFYLRFGLWFMELASPNIVYNGIILSHSIVKSDTHTHLWFSLFTL